MKAINALIMKPNQNGSLIDVARVVELARKNNIKMIFSHRSGETMENILAAINAVSENDEHVALNKRIIKDAQFLCELAKAKLNLVNAYPATPVNIAIEIPEFNPGVYNESVKKHHIESTTQLANDFNLTTEQCFIEEGLPEDVIPDVAKRLNSELVVIGTVGRTGLSAALVGNTAEHVIDSLDCDVLALKPDGYVSPLAKS